MTYQYLLLLTPVVMAIVLTIIVRRITRHRHH